MQHTTKPITRVTSEGFIVKIKENAVIGYKCTACSTVHVTDETTYSNIDLLCQYIEHCQMTHRFCK
jgi:hypothetical protein